MVSELASAKPSTEVVEITTSEHVADAVALGQVMHEELGVGEFNQDHAVRYAVSIASSDRRQHSNAWVVYRSGEPCGLLVAHAQFLFSRAELFATHDLWYVLPEFRGSPAALYLWHAFESWADEIGARRTYAVVSDLPAQDNDVVCNLLERIGYTGVGIVLVKDKNNAERATAVEPDAGYREPPRYS